MAAADHQPGHRKRIRSRRTILLVIGLLVLAAIVCGAIIFSYPPLERHITISRETTYITSPVNPDGTINYVAALNEMMSKGVTPENNAAVLLVRAFGPDVFDRQIRQAALQRLGIGDLPVEGSYFTELDEYEGDGPDASLRPKYGTPEWNAQHDLLDKLVKTPWSPQQHPRIAAWLKANEKPLSLVVEASGRPRYHVPLISPSSPPMLMNAEPYVFSFKTSFPLCRALAVRSMLRLRAGDVHGSLADILAVHRLGRLIAQRPMLVEQVCATGIENLACQAELALVAGGKLTPPEAKAQLRVLDALGPMPDISVGYDCGERMTALDSVMMIYRGGDPDELLESTDQGASPARKGSPAALDWDYMLRTVNYWYDRMTEACKRPTARQRCEALDAVHEDLKRTTAEQKRFAIVKVVLGLVGGRGTRRWLTQMMTSLMLTASMPIGSSAISNREAAAMRLELVKLSLALAAFKAEKGVYPQKLSELSPAYIKTVPADIFAEGPLIYKRDGKGYLLYSVGANMKDDGGVEDEAAGKDDISVRVK